MSRTLIASSLVIVALFSWDVRSSLAQESRMTRGTITSLATDSVTVKVGSQDLVFGVDPRTVVETRGGATKTRAAKSAGRPGPQLSELLHAGQSVEVTYHTQAGERRASLVRGIAKLSQSDGGEHSDGTVTSVSATSLAIQGKNGKALFTQTFAIDPHTKVIGKGLSTMAASKGGRIAITDAVAVGDTVGVWFKTSSDALHASEVHVKGHPSSSVASK
jgi:hypothetical protein